MVKQISPDEADRLLQEKSVIIADVRDESSYQASHIPNAIHMSVALLQEFCESAERDQAILVYCYHGISSQAVAQHLVEQGFTEVYSLIGGYELWKQHHKS